MLQAYLFPYIMQTQKATAYLINGNITNRVDNVLRSGPPWRDLSKTAGCCIMTQKTVLKNEVLCGTGMVQFTQKSETEVCCKRCRSQEVEVSVMCTLLKKPCDVPSFLAGFNMFQPIFVWGIWNKDGKMGLKPVQYWSGVPDATWATERSLWSCPSHGDVVSQRCRRVIFNWYVRCDFGCYRGVNLCEHLCEFS